jgi:hypothetical protein
LYGALLLLLLLLQFLSQQKWSLNACEQVLANHQAASSRQQQQGRPAYDHINRCDIGRSDTSVAAAAAAAAAVAAAVMVAVC